MNATQIEREVTEEQYDDFLEGVYGDSIEVCGMNMSPLRILKECDPIAYDCGKADYESSLDEDSPVYACGECNTEFDDEDEAEECCKIECEECGDMYETQDDADNCCEKEDN